MCKSETRSSFLRPFLPLLLCLALGSVAHAQCRTYTKNTCIPPLEPYISNGQFNGATMFEGESAALMQTFYSGQEYRLLVCTHSSLEGAWFEVRDSGKKLLYSSKETGHGYWDFNVASTQQLQIEVFVPSLGSRPELKKSGCVSIMVGFK